MCTSNAAGIYPGKTVPEGFLNSGEHCSISVDNQQWFTDYLPITGGNSVELFVDGKDYGQSLQSSLDEASGQVLLTGLHFDPDWQLIRDGGTTHTLLESLCSVARRRVQIYLIANQFWRDEIQAYNGIITGAITDAGHLDWYIPKTIRLFDGLASFPNVHCRTDVHRGFVFSTHHQKTVVIDEKIAYIGGIDLTAVDGDRWDTNQHVIPLNSATDLRNYNLPEKLWHDVHCKITGPAVRFILDNFHARWNYGRLLKNLAIRTRTRTVRTSFGIPVSWEEQYLYAEEDSNRHIFPPVVYCDGIYQSPTRKVKEAPDITSRCDPTDPLNHSCDMKEIKKLNGIKIQIVRSIPQGEFVPGHQKPSWNLSPLDWERATKDAYLIGIRAASEYIYFENQWISDEHIWAELELAAKRNRDNPNFRIVIMLPRNPLSAAGYGSNQDVDLSAEVKAMVSACKSAIQFGMYCIVAEIPQSRRDSIGLSEDDIDRYGDSTAQIYVHSKILIIDDKWSLIGSANAGGISLEGISNPGATYRGATPDSELSAIIYDADFARQFRQKLWSEHLENIHVGNLSVDKAADMFREKASENRHRVRFANEYKKLVRHGGDAIRRVPKSVVLAVQQTASIISCKGPEITLTTDETALFALVLQEPGNGYEIYYRWSLRDSKNNAWLLRGLPSMEVVQGYGPDRVSYIPSRTAAALQSRMKGREAAHILCRFMITPKGILPRSSGADQDRYSVLITLPVTLVGS